MRSWADLNVSSAVDCLRLLQRLVTDKGVAAPTLAGDDSWQAVAFIAGSHPLVVNMKQVSEVVEVSSITGIPGVQPWIAGIANVRGVMLPLIDIGLYLGGTASRNRARCHVISLNRTDSFFGLIVDRIVGMRQISHEKIEQNVEQQALGPYITGKVQIGDETWQIFDPDRLLFSDKFNLVAAA